MKLGSVTMVVLFVLGSFLTGWRFLDGPDVYVVGGSYIIRAGDVLPGNLRAVFAQVTVEQGARVTGDILSVSSALDLGGGVGGEVLAVGSDVTVRQTARLAAATRHVGAMPYVFLLPQMLRVGNAVQGRQ